MKKQKTQDMENRAAKLRPTLFGNTRQLCFAALLAAMSFILGKFLQIPNPVQNVVRISFENFPVILAGVLMGPVIGALTGAIADVIGCLLYGYAINPIITLGAASVGLVSGVCAMLIRRPLWLRVCVCVVASHLLGSVLLKSVGLAAWYLNKYNIGFGTLVLWRLGVYAVIAVVEGVMIYALLRNSAVAAQFQRLRTPRRAREGRKDEP